MKFTLARHLKTLSQYFSQVYKQKLGSFFEFYTKKYEQPPLQATKLFLWFFVNSTDIFVQYICNYLS